MRMPFSRFCFYELEHSSLRRKFLCGVSRKTSTAHHTVVAQVAAELTNTFPGLDDDRKQLCAFVVFFSLGLDKVPGHVLDRG